MKFLQAFLIFTSFLLISNSVAYGQCTANAGKDTTFCVNNGFDGHFLGGAPTVSGGTPPYSYTWSAYYTMVTIHFTASFFLDDTTLANPKLIHQGFDSLAFNLTVTDSLGNTCHDTVVIRFCSFVISTADPRFFISQGDSLYVSPGLSANCSPIIYEWSPNYNISDLNIPNPIVWPDTTTFYAVKVTDSAGCQAFGFTNKVFVTPTGIEEHKGEPIIQIYPNPTANFTTFRISGSIKKEFTLELYDNLGRKLKKFKVTERETKLDLSDYFSGIYHYRLLENEKQVAQGKLVVF